MQPQEPVVFLTIVNSGSDALFHSYKTFPQAQFFKPLSLIPIFSHLTE